MTEADLEEIARLEGELFGAEAWSRDLLTAELEASRGPRADRRYVVVESDAETDAEPDVEPDGAGEERGADHADSRVGLRARAGTGPTGGRLLGYAGLYHAGGLTSADLLTIATVPAVRGRGLASRMLAELVDTARKAGCPDVLLEVRQSNQTAQGLYARHGFVPIGRRRRYYQAPPEDAVVMRLILRQRLGPLGAAEVSESSPG